MASQPLSKRTAPLELRHLSATKLLDPSDLRISTDLGNEGDMSEENIPNYDGDWNNEPTSAEYKRERANGRPRSYHSPIKQDDAENEEGENVHPETIGEQENGSTDEISVNQSVQTAAARAAEHSSPKLSSSPPPKYPPAEPPNPYRPQVGPAVYKQLQLDDEHEDHDIVIHQESDLDIHSPGVDELHSWGRRGGRDAQEGWLYRKWKGVLEMMCMAVPCAP
ncbi:uncharacterized protein SPPG_02723 [Spizellomyces punctatus DAOM BR117]|uniref:Uncharacterized protein n=1 Tax=Spizellomyces punctatus (strain DAOM BR117) TaxID=645134 RepID=A0A0L0HMB5_SPIPD|nr:uncharacterized protein SPPG_02723 [Spizellomyces punctatus DAOM BR117]KND02242.1 hypothetical protein SPPG_02723 [Spizellomyces punctatus DAOM BR117]|eukprot:XP_016610281.1 hypothetical protein SPPG_02723 [Spizellomyces punctatus DAOM BR117]